MSKAFEVEIYGQRYMIRGEADEAYVQELARRVPVGEFYSCIAWDGLLN